MESTTEIVSTTVDHPVEVKSEGIVEPNATATITTSSITIERTNQSIDDENIEENVTSLIKQTIVISPEPVGSLSSSSAPETLPPQTVNESNLINGDSIKDQPLQVIKETVVTVVKDEIRKVVTEETKPTEALPTSSPIIEILEEPDDASLKVDETPKEESTVTSTDEVIEPVLTETVVKRGNNTDKAEAESTEQPSVQDLSDAKYPQRPPPPKLSEQGKRTQTLSTSPSNDVITNGVGQNQQHQQQHQPQQQQQHHNQEATPEYKRPSFKSNLKHAFSNIRKSFKRKDQTPNPNDFQPSQKSTHRNNYHRNNNNNNVDNDYHHGDVHKTSEELQESLSNVQSFDSSINDSPEFKRHSDTNNYRKNQNEIEAVNSLGNIAPPAIPTKMSADPNNPIYVNHSLHSSTIDKKANDDTDKHIYANSQELNNARKAKEFAAAAIADSVIIDQLAYEETTYWRNVQHPRSSINNYRQNHFIRSEQCSPHPVSRSQSQLTNSRAVKPFMTPDLRSRATSSPKPARPNQPPILSPLDQQIPDHVSTNRHEVNVRRLDIVNSMKLQHNKHLDYESDHTDSGGYRETIQGQYQPHYYSYTMRADQRIDEPYNVSGSLDGRYPQEYEQYPYESRRIQTMRPTDYPSRLRERIHVYRPVSASGGVMAGTLQYDEYSRNGTLKPRKPKPIAEHYKCSEVYNWPPKFPKLKRRKTHPPKQIHTAQDHVVIKSQTRQPVNYQATLTNQTRSSEPVHCIKVSPQCQTLGYNKRDSSYSPERQVTSLHSLQRSTLLEKSNRTVEPASRDQLFIADYKQMPSAQMSSDKSNLITPPYFTRIAENKRLAKFNFNHTNNNNNNIVVSADIIQSESPKALNTLKDTLKSMHPFLQDWINKNDKVDGSGSQNDEQKPSDKVVINCLSEYLYTCMKLRSLDLQGEYAAFVFPLKHFNEKSWNNYGAIEGWEDLSIVCAPNTNYEYVVLKESNIHSNKLKYTQKTIDKLLTNWLDNQTTKSPTPTTNASHKTNTLDQKAKASSDEKILHSIFMATSLKSILSLDDKEKQPDINIQILVNCIKLGVLLSLSECLHNTTPPQEVPHDINRSVEFDLKPENILLILSASNCLTIFKPYAKLHHPADQQNHQTSPSHQDEAAKSETHEKDSSKDSNQHNNTLKSFFTNLHINQGESINDVINEIMKQLHELAKHEFQASSPEVTTSLLKAVAPPDWIAMTLARICLYNQQTTS